VRVRSGMTWAIDPTTPVPLGGSGLTVTLLGLGTGSLGGLFEPVEEEAAHEAVRRAYQMGVRTFDTAPLYGFGLAERRLGRALSAYPRDSYVLSTKVGRLLRRDAPPDHMARTYYYPKVDSDLDPVFDFSYDATMASFEESLERLGLDRVDIVHIHDPDDHWEQAISGAYPALHELRRQGVIRAVGAGMMQAGMLARFAREGDFDCFLVAGRYTLLDHSALPELLPLCLAKGIRLFIGSPYNTGLLIDPGPDSTFDFMPAPAEVVERAQRLQAVCRRHGVPLMAAAIQFPFAHPAVATVLTGARSVAELEENARMMRVEIPPGLWAELRDAGLLPPEAPTPDAPLRP
jgi:D-threo-aldose 1-dehydrogenase